MYTLKGAHENKRIDKANSKKKTTENGLMGCVMNRKSYRFFTIYCLLRQPEEILLK